MYVKLLRYCKGTISFRMYGSGIENTLNDALCDNIKLWKLKQKKQVIYGFIAVSDYFYFCKIAKKNGTRVHIIKKIGVPFYLYRLFQRKGLVVGAVFSIICLLLSQNFIWAIEIHDYEGKDREYLTEVMQQHGIKIGSYIPDLDFRRLQQEILIEVQDISWMALNRKGTVLEAEVSEKVIPPEIKENYPCNVIAKRSGQIIHMDVYNGKETVALKQAVSKGDLLVSGVVDDIMGNVRQVHAEAKVIANTVRTHTVQFNLNQTERIYLNDSKERFALEVLGLKIPLYINFSLPYLSDVKEDKEYLNLLGYTYPVAILKENHNYYQMKKKQYTKQQGKEIIKNALKVYEQEELANIKILSTKDKEEMKNGMLSITREYDCEEDIAAKMQLYIHE